VKCRPDACFAPPAFELGRNDPRIVEDQHILRTQDRRQVEDVAVRDPASLDEQHPRGIARAGRTKGDAVGRKVEVE
jgi:hypothetical protein